MVTPLPSLPCYRATISAPELYVHADISIFLLRRTKGTGQGVPLCDVCVGQPEALAEGVVDARYAAAVDVQISDFNTSFDTLSLTVMHLTGSGLRMYNSAARPHSMNAHAHLVRLRWAGQ